MSDLSTLATDAAGKLDVLWHDGHTLGVDRAKVGVLEETDEVSLASLLQSHHRGALEAKIGLEVLSDLTDQTLERELAQKQLGGLLVTTDLTQGDGSGPVAVRLLDATGGGCRLASGLRGQLLARRLSAGGLAGSLFGTSHFESLELRVANL